MKAESSYSRFLCTQTSPNPWLGLMPAHWRRQRMKDLAELRLSNADKHSVEGEPQVSLCNYVDVYMNEEITESIDFMAATASIDQIKRLKLCLGDVLLTKDSESPLDIGVSSIVRCESPNLICGYHLGLLRPTNAYGPFLKRYLDSHFAKAYFYISAKGMTRYALGKGEISCLPIYGPPIEEQKLIASFLDTETAKIDHLIQKQERLIELLQEKRQAVISHAVTKGLDPTVSMKNSGLDWIGSIPIHWELRRVKSTSEFTTSGPRGWSDLVSDIGSVFVQSGDLTESLGVDFTKSKRVEVASSAEAERTRLKDGDVVVCITGAKTGKVAVCSTVPETAYINQHLCLIRPNRAVNSKFLGFWLNSHFGQTYLDMSQYGLKQGLSLDDVREAPVALPPRWDQDAILRFLDSEIAKIDALSAKAKESIDLLKERRSALISAAVTGKIDVREVA